MRRKIDSLEKDQMEAETKAAEIRYDERPNENLANFYMLKATKFKEIRDECREELKKIGGQDWGGEGTKCMTYAICGFFWKYMFLFVLSFILF